MANFKEKKYTVDDIAKIRKGMEEADVRRKEEIAKQTNTAPIYGNKIPTLEQVSKTKIAQGKDNASLSIKAQEAKNADRAREAAVKKATRETRKQVNNIAKNVGDTNINRYNSRFSIDKPIQNISADDLRAMQENRLKSEKRDQERIAENNARQENRMNRIDNEIKSIQNKGMNASQSDMERLNELTNLANNANLTQRKTDNYLVSRDRYDKLMQDGRFRNDIEDLFYATPTGDGTNIIPEGYKNYKEFLSQLSRRYSLTEDELEDIAKTYRSDAKKATEQRVGANLERIAENNGALGTGISVLSSFPSGVEGIANILGGYTQDDRNRSNLFGTAYRAPKEAVSNNIDNPLGKFAYDTGVGGLTMVANAALAGPFGIVANAGNTGYDAQQRALANGANLADASTFGLVAGGADAFFNAKGFNAIEEGMKASIKASAKEGVKDFLKTTAKTAGTNFSIEGLENVAQDVVETVADSLINNDNSELSTQYNNLVNSGANPSEAFNKVTEQYAMQLLQSGVAGGVAGLGFGAVKGGAKNASAYALGKYIDWDSNRRSAKTNERLQGDLVRLDAMKSPEVTNENVNIADNVPEITNEVVNNTVDPQNVIYHNEDLSTPTSNDTKQRQLDIIQRTNPSPDDYHTWVRDTDDIKTFEEVWAEEPDIDPDFTDEMAQEAMRTGKIKVYSSYNIEDGTFVTPSYMEALAYAGNPENVKSDVVNLNDVAWIDSTQGQLARISNDTEMPTNEIPRVGEAPSLFTDNNVNDNVDSLIRERENLVSQINQNGLSMAQMVDAQNRVKAFDAELSQTHPELYYDGKFVGKDYTTYDTYEEGSIPDENQVMAEDIGINPRTNADEGYIIESEPIGGNGIRKEGYRKTYTNTYVNAGINTLEEALANPDAKYTKESQQAVLNKATENLDNNGENILKDYVSGEKQIDTSLDAMQAMLLMSDPDLSKVSKNSIMRNMAVNGTEKGRFIKAFDMIANTAEQAFLNATKLSIDLTDGWKKRNKSIRTTNDKIASKLKTNYDTVTEGIINAKLNKAILDLSRVRKEKIENTRTPEQIREDIKYTLEQHNLGNRFDDNGIDVLANYIENIPTWQLTDQLRHFLQSGEFYSQDESLPIARQKSGKLASALSNMGNKGKKNVEKPEIGFAKRKERVINTLEDEFGSIEGIFDDNAINQIVDFEEANIPTWQLTDQIEHFLLHGEFYPIETETPESVPISNRLTKILDNVVNGKKEKTEKTPDTYEQTLEKVINTLDRESSSVRDIFNETDEQFIATMFNENIPSWQIEDEIRHRLQYGEWYTLDESIAKAKPTNSLVQSALRMNDPEYEQNIKQPTIDEIMEQVRNTLDEEVASLPTVDVATLGDMLKNPKSYTYDDFASALNTIDGSIDTTKLELDDIRNRLSEAVKNNAELADLTIKNSVGFTDNDVKYIAEMIMQGASKKEIAEALNTKMATGRFGISDEAQTKVNELFKYARQFNENSTEFVTAQAEAFRILANELVPKASAFEKFDSWRYIAMLGNPKTMLRNYVGNKVFGAVTGVSNSIGALLESGTDKIYNAKTGKHLQRTKAIINPKKDKSLLEATKKDASIMRGRQIEGAKYEKMNKEALKKYRSVFDSKTMRSIENAVDRGISDKKAVIAKYSTSLAGYMKANRLTQADLEASYRYDELSRRQLNGQKLSNAERVELARTKNSYVEMEKARDYALKQAEYATFHEDNAVANLLNRASNINGLSKVLVEGLVPFKKTPANILKSGVQYSPLGAIESVIKTGKLIYENTGSRKKYDDTYTKRLPIIDKDVDINRTLASDVIDSWSKSLTGGMLCYLGAYLFNKGIIHSSTKDEKYQDELEGKQNYSIEINGKTYTIDWLAPSAMPLLMGAEIAKVMEENAILKEKWYENPDKMISTINGLIEPLIETSMLQGVENTFNAISGNPYEEQESVEKALNMAAVMGTNYLSQAIPTLSGQIARTVDNTRRQTDTANEGVVGTLEKQGRKAMNKIPFLSKLNTPYVNARGEEQNNSVLDYVSGEPLRNIGRGVVNLGYQMVSPSYISEIDTRPSDTIARNAYNGLDEEGKPIRDADVFADWKSSLKVNGVKLNPEQMYTYRQASGSANTEIREALAKEDWFNELSPTEQTELLKSTNTLVDHIGKKAVDESHVTSSKEYEAYSNGGIPSLMKYYQDDAHKNEVKNAMGSTAEYVMNIYDNGSQADIDEYNKASSIGKEYGFDNITEKQWKTYDVKGEKEFRKELEYAQKAKESGVSDTEAFRKSVDNKSVDNYINAYNAITQTQIGTDDLGTPQYMSYNDTTAKIYKDKGQTGLNNYVKVQSSVKDDKDTSYISALNNTSMSEADKAYYFVLHKGKNVAKSAPTTGDLDVYKWYLIKNAVDADNDGKLKASEKSKIIPYIESHYKSELSKMKDWTFN